MISTPINPSEIYTMMHEEEELQYEISKLWYQVQQILILWRAAEHDIDGLKSEMEAKLDILKDQIIANMDDKLVEYHIENQQQVLQPLKDNLNLAQNRETTGRSTSQREKFWCRILRIFTATTIKKNVPQAS